MDISMMNISTGGWMRMDEDGSFTYGIGNVVLSTKVLVEILNLIYL